MEKKFFRNYFKEVLTVQRSPHRIAIGFAVGTFISILPTPGINIVLGLLALFVYPKMSKISLFSAFIVWNPLLTPFLYGTATIIGQYFFSEKNPVLADTTFLILAYSLAKKVILGLVILAVLLSILGYIIVYAIVKYYQKGKTIHP